MLITKITGGLGNQLFQYALARRLARSANIEFKLDLSAYNNANSRAYALNNFNVIEKIASTDEINRFRKIGFCRVIDILKPNHLRSIIKERRSYFDQNILKIKDNTYLDGYWQCDKYFSDIREILLKEISLKNGFSENAQKMAESIRQVNSVSLHIRRGDYLNSKFSKFYEPCKIEYYQQAIKALESKIKDIHFFVFSDDIEWAKKNLTIPYPTIFVSNPNIKDYEEMMLMSLCKHNIITNSTFSWWGAWLNQNPDEIVIAPEKWFKIKTKKYDARSLYPAGWLII
jgi:hypothetical protein